MAFGLPVEGTAGPFAGSALSEPATCGPDETAASVVGRLPAESAQVLVVNEQAIVLGAAARSALAQADEGVTVAEVMQSSPTTVRPSVELADLTEAEATTVVTDSDGRLLGVVEPGAGGDDHLDALGGAFLDLAHAVSDHFGDREPSEEEVQAFLEDRERQPEPGAP